jgi:DNA-binding XRE family transcriptional regulator
MAQAARHLDITEQTYYHWRKEYGPTNYAGLALIVLSIAKSLIIGLSIAVSVFLIIIIRAVYKVHRKNP